MFRIIVRTWVLLCASGCAPCMALRSCGWSRHFVFFFLKKKNFYQFSTVRQINRKKPRVHILFHYSKKKLFKTLDFTRSTPEPPLNSDSRKLFQLLDKSKTLTPSIEQIGLQYRLCSISVKNHFESPVINLLQSTLIFPPSYP